MKRKAICIALVMVLAINMIACKEAENSVETTEAEEPEVVTSVYNISACLQIDNDYNRILLKGFEDCLQDYLGEDKFYIFTRVADENIGTDTIAASVESSTCDLVFTAGNKMLLSAESKIKETPIVATGVVDFQNTLRIASIGGNSWNKTTGMNVTGVSSKPSIVDQVSLLIEATPDLEAVGILYSPEDTESLYQNELFEKYLDQAGIPWKEYLIPVSSEIAEPEESEYATLALMPSKFVADNAKAGMDNYVQSFGDESDAGINSPSSTRVASVSKYWTGGKIPVVEENEPDDSEEVADQVENEEATEETEETEETIEQCIQQVCDECSAIYIPYGSMVADHMELVSRMAIANGVTTVGGDTILGANSLVMLFNDPYKLGYAAGKKAVKVLNGSDISKMKISYTSSDDAIKLYNGEIAEAMGMEFPKSFKEYNSFLAEYEYGSTTTRYESTDEE